MDYTHKKHLLKIKKIVIKVFYLYEMEELKTKSPAFLNNI